MLVGHRCHFRIAKLSEIKLCQITCQRAEITQSHNSIKSC